MIHASHAWHAARRFVCTGGMPWGWRGEVHRPSRLSFHASEERVAQHGWAGSHQIRNSVKFTSSSVVMPSTYMDLVDSTTTVLYVLFGSPGTKCHHSVSPLHTNFGPLVVGTDTERAVAVLYAA